MEQAILVALIIGLTEAIKRATGLQKRYIPLLAVILGVVLSILSVLPSIAGNFLSTILPALFSGIVAGLISCGLYDFGKKTILGK